MTLKPMLWLPAIAIPILLCGWALSDDDDQIPVSFARTTIDIGVVVSDVDRSLAFYKNALGFREIDGFDVPAGMGGDSGLTDGLPFHVHVLVLGEGETATKLKLMQFKQQRGAKTDQTHIHSSIGYSYLTIFVDDTTAAVERAAKHGVKPIARGPVPLPAGFPQGVFLTLVRDPDGNLIELVGPQG